VQRRIQILEALPQLKLNADGLTLAERLVSENAVPAKAALDAIHIAIATVHGMDYLLTWNFRHIANATMRSQIELICRTSGHEPPVICSPQELLEVS
jgi:hypothetical protein